MATNWLQQLKPLAAFSAQHSLTRRANWCRFTSKSTWLKRLECPTISPASVDGFLACFAYQRFNQKRRPFCQFFFRFRMLLGQEWHGDFGRVIIDTPNLVSNFCEACAGNESDVAEPTTVSFILVSSISRVFKKASGENQPTLLNKI